MARKLIVEIVGDASSLERAFKKSNRSAQKFQGNIEKTGRNTKRTFGGMSRGLAGFAAGFVGTYGLVSVARTAFGEMAEAQKVTAQTNAVLKSTGKVAGVSAKHVETLAGQLMTLSGVDDELIQSSENVLLTFRDIRNQAGKGNKVFDEATRAALDMSVALDKDLQGSAIQVGKALNDPIKGVGALRRVGVQFTDAQQDQIKALVESGDKLKAQKVILEELRAEFGGSAEAAGKTLPGKLNILRNTLTNLAGSFAAVLTPEITKLVDKMVDWISKTKNQKAVLDTFKAAVSAVRDVVLLLKGAFDALNSITGSTKNTFKVLLGFFIAFKALRLASYITKMAAAMKAYSFWSAAASAGGTGGLAGGMPGKAGRFAKLGKVLKFAGPIGAGLAVGTAANEFLPGKVRGPRVTDWLGITGRGDDRPRQTVVQVDGKTIARATGRHTDADLRRRRNQRGHKRR